MKMYGPPRLIKANKIVLERGIVVWKEAKTCIVLLWLRALVKLLLENGPSLPLSCDMVCNVRIHHASIF